MACYSQTCLLDVSELSGPRLFPHLELSESTDPRSSIMSVYSAEWLHGIQSSSARKGPVLFSRLSGWHWWYSGEHSCLPDYLGAGTGLSDKRTSVAVRLFTALCLGHPTPLVHLWILHRACHFTSFLSKPSLLSVHSVVSQPSPRFSGLLHRI